MTTIFCYIFCSEWVEFRHGSPAGDRSDTRRSGSPEKSVQGLERASRGESASGEGVQGGSMDYTPHSHSASPIPGLADKKSDSMSDSTSDKDRTRTLSAGRHSRERSFERSLDNILDKCSEKSLDLNLSVDSWNGTVSEGGSRSLDQPPSSVSKSAKSDKKKKASWYTVRKTFFCLFFKCECVCVSLCVFHCVYHCV